MIKSSVTISVVDEARGGPFVFWDDVEASCIKARELGFDSVELFAPGPDVVDSTQLKQWLDDNKLGLAAVGTGGGWVIRKLALTSAVAEERAQAVDFIRSMIDFGGQFGAPAIIGSMQGRWGGDMSKETALGHLRDALNELGPHAAKHGVPLIYEPLNRYETNLINTMGQGVEFLKTLDNDNVKLLADLFHMNIEETSIADGIRDGGSYIGHVHFVDSNRRPAGCGHMVYEPIAAALKEINYDGYASAEAFPYPDPDAAAEQTIKAYKQVFGS